MSKRKKMGNILTSKYFYEQPKINSLEQNNTLKEKNVVILT